MEIWGTPILADVREIIYELRAQLAAEGIDLFRQIKPSGINLMCSCVEHAGGQESNPSMGITLQDVKRGSETIPAGTAHCFTCGFTADLPHLVSYCFGYNDRGYKGYKWVCENFVNLSIETRKSLNLELTRNKSKKSTKNVEVIDEHTLSLYRYTHPYMFQRKLTDKVITYFDVGYDKATQSLTFPVHDISGQVLFIQRRAVNGKQFRNETDIPKVVYGLHHVYRNLSWIKEVWITESIIDALTCWTYRIPAVSIMGARATEGQIKLLKEMPVRKIILALDNDKAGHEGARKLLAALNRDKLIFKAVLPENRKDLNELTDSEFKALKRVLFFDK